MKRVVVVTGGRNLADRAVVFAELQKLQPDLIVEGGARGADAFARQYAELHRVQGATFWASWDMHGKAAGAIRNRKMMHFAAVLAQAGAVVTVLAFPTGGPGTEDAIVQAKAVGLHGLIIDCRGKTL